MSGTVIDKATALKHSMAGSNINKIVCKASSHDIAGPKKKHVDFLLALTNNPQANLVLMSDMLSERLHTNTNWVVVFKALITSHTLMTLGNEKYLQALATKSEPFELESFTDRTTVQATEMTPYIHKYSRYIGSICSSYRSVAIDFFRMPKGDSSPFRTMEATKLLKCTVLIQTTIDKLLEFEVTRGELNNGVINTSFTMLYQDLTKLYAAYNDALINVLEHFFEMKKSQCKAAVDCYRKFMTRQQSVTRFLSVAEDVGIDRKKHLNLRQVPEDLLPALEQHLEEMDAIRKTANVKQPSPQIQAASAKLSELKSKSPSGSGKNSPAPTSSVMPSANEEVLSAQRKRFEALKKRASDKTLKVDDFLSPSSKEPSPNRPTNTEEDEFTAMATTRSTPQLQQKTNVMDELMNLDSQGWGGSNTGGSSGGNSPWGTPTPANNNPFSVGGAAPSGGNPWGNAGGYQEIGLFSTSNPPQSTNSSNNGMGDILMPMSSGPYATQQQTQPQPQKLTTDVDSSLAMAATNLSLELGGNKGTGMGTTTAMKKSTHQWGNESTQKTATLTGGVNYQGQRQLQPTTLPPMQMGGAPSMGNQPTNWSTGMYGGGGGAGGYYPTQPQLNPFGAGMQSTNMGGVGGYNPSMPGNMFGSGFPPQQPPQSQFPQQPSPFSTNTQQPSLF